MFYRLYNFIGNFFSKTRTIDNEPLNKVSLIVLILIDIFIVVNVFSGLEDISRWHISPSETYPCYREWTDYQKQKHLDKDYRIIKRTITARRYNSLNFEQKYRDNTDNRLGQVSTTCIDYAWLKDNLKNSDNQKIITTISRNSETVSKLEQANRQIKSQYDSTLLEKIAGQANENSINSTTAERAKQEIANNNSQIAAIESAIASLKQQLLAKSDNQKFIAFLDDRDRYNSVKEKYDQASFWYPIIQLGFQSLFLLPLIFFTAAIHQFSQRKGSGLVSLISWHLLVIFCIPLIVKLLQFLQIGFVFETISNWLRTIFLNLLFLVHYVYILLIPLVGFGIIKLFQKVVFNPKVQAAKRIQKSRCVKCAKKIKQVDSYCPHCGEYQYTECTNCHRYTYKFSSYCNQCGSVQDSQ